MPYQESLWNTLAMGFFFVLFGLCALLLNERGMMPALLILGPLDFVLISFAAFRLTHLLTYDKIFGFIRTYFKDTGAPQKPAHFAKRLMYELLDCIWCTGMWSGLIVLTLYLLGPWGRFFVFVFAAAGAASLLQLVSLSINGVRKE